MRAAAVKFLICAKAGEGNLGQKTIERTDCSKVKIETKPLL